MLQPACTHAMASTTVVDHGEADLVCRMREVRCLNEHKLTDALGSGICISHCAHLPPTRGVLTQSEQQSKQPQQSFVSEYVQGMPGPNFIMYVATC
jgi:hypothetical protein